MPKSSEVPVSLMTACLCAASQGCLHCATADGAYVWSTFLPMPMLTKATNRYNPDRATSATALALALAWPPERGEGVGFRRQITTTLACSTAAGVGER